MCRIAIQTWPGNSIDSVQFFSRFCKIACCLLTFQHILYQIKVTSIRMRVTVQEC